jgi:3-phenylpropionate/trans-cinnamate dioxygenase ferredoxin reductase component
VLGERVRVEHWANALNQAKTAALAMLGSDAHYEELPFFYTDQYDLGMEFIGHVPRSVDAHVVVRGDLDAREFVAFWLDGDNRLLASMNVNVWDVVDEIKPLVAARAVVDPAKLTDDGYAYSDLAAG